MKDEVFYDLKRAEWSGKITPRIVEEMEDIARSVDEEVEEPTKEEIEEILHDPQVEEQHRLIEEYIFGGKLNN